MPLFAVMAAIVVRGETVGGIIYDPMGDDWMLAERGVIDPELNVDIVELDMVERIRCEQKEREAVRTARDGEADALLAGTRDRAETAQKASGSGFVDGADLIHSGEFAARTGGLSRALCQPPEISPIRPRSWLRSVPLQHVP